MPERTEEDVAADMLALAEEFNGRSMALLEELREIYRRDGRYEGPDSFSTAVLTKRERFNKN